MLIHLTTRSGGRPDLDEEPPFGYDGDVPRDRHVLYPTVCLERARGDFATPADLHTLHDVKSDTRVRVRIVNSDMAGERGASRAGSWIFVDSDPGCEHPRVQRASAGGVTGEEEQPVRPGAFEGGRPHLLVEDRLVDSLWR